MRFLRNFVRFWYDFVIGDDWRVAAGVIIVVPLVYAAAHHGINAWWLLPIAVAALLAVSVGVEARRTRATRRT
jgi:succinate dehydrogenase/fumarate reductase cytochrome b subunit